MLSVKKLNLEQAATYYQKDNYYTKQIGEFHGSLKDELGLYHLTHRDFMEFLNGRNRGEFLTASKTKNSVPAFDFTFSANKSLSIAYEIAMKNDKEFAQKLADIHNTAVNKALDYIEKNHIQTRTQKKKKKRVEKTNNMLVAKFQHDTSRELDPQLHTHCVIFNLTKDSSSKFKTLDMSNLLKKNSKIVRNLGSYYRHHLKQEILKAGIDIRVTNQKENFFELKNIDDNLIEAFSKRREAIEKEVKNIKSKYPNATKTELYQIATLNTRVAKKDVDRDKVRDINIKTAAQIINTKELLKTLKQNSSFKKEKQNIDDKSLVKVVKKTQKEIKNKYHQTTDNIAIVTLSKLQNIKVDIDKVFNIVKNLKEKEQIIDEVKSEIKELKTMHDIVKDQLSSLSFKTLDLKNRVKNVNIDKAKDNLIERIENGKSKHTQNCNANEAYKRFIKITSSITTTATTDVEKFKRQYQFINRTDVTKRATRRFKQRGDEFKRDESYSIRDVARDYNYYQISKDELKRDSSMIKSQSKSKNQENVR